jgi:CAAX protease family protein
MQRRNPTELLAGGSLPPDDPHRPRGLALKAWLACELALIFVGAPLAMRWAVFELRVPLFIILQPVLLGLVVYLLWDRSFLMRRELSQGFPWHHLAQIIVKFIVIGSSVTAATYIWFPSSFLGFPRYATELWLLVMVLYPMLSVIAQELVYRTFFFHRYGRLFGGALWPAILVNGALFGFGHIMFGNWIAVIGTAGLGALLAYRYALTRSFWAVWFEHSLYGWLVFTVGLGRFFYTGVSNLN